MQYKDRFFLLDIPFRLLASLVTQSTLLEVVIPSLPPLSLSCPWGCSHCHQDPCTTKPSSRAVGTSREKIDLQTVVLLKKSSAKKAFGEGRYKPHHTLPNPPQCPQGADLLILPPLLLQGTLVFIEHNSQLSPGNDMA